ncbi:hypothetical protein KO525_10165, partial [Psychrosphaera sp. B3R10]
INDINDMRFNEGNYDVDLLLIKYFGSCLEEQRLSHVKSILVCICECSAQVDKFTKLQLKNSSHFHRVAHIAIHN